MADHRLTPDQVALLADGRARAEAVEGGVALVLGDDRLILPTADLDRIINAIVQVEYLLGEAFVAVTSRGRARR